MSDVKVEIQGLRSAEKGWHQQHTELLAARRQLADVEGSTSTAGPRVAPVLDAFLSTWVDELKKHASAAERHSDSLDAAAANYDKTDEASRADLANLLPWDQVEHRTPPAHPGAR